MGVCQIKGKFFLYQTIDIPDEDIEDCAEFIGVDMGVTDIAVTSEDDTAVTGHCSAKDVGFWLESMARHDRSFANVLKKVVEKI